MRPSLPPLPWTGNKDKKLAALDIVNVSIKIYFRLNTLRLCKNLIRTVDSRQFAAFDMFPASQRVTYKFYVGRLAVFDENYVRGGCARRLAPRPMPPEARIWAAPSQRCPCLAACVQLEAQESLEYALQHCHKQAQRNKALVLKYLVPVGGTLHGLLCPADDCVRRGD